MLPYSDFGDSIISDKQQMKKKVFVSGCYDLLHSGHVELQKYYERVKEQQFSHRVMLGEQGEIAIPTAEFNLIFQLTHIYSHLMNEGIWLRQLVDYYYVLCDFYKVYQIFSNPSVSLSKGSSTFSPSPSSMVFTPPSVPPFPGGRNLRSGDVTAPSRCSEPLRSKDGGASKPSPNCAGWDRRGKRVYS